MAISLLALALACLDKYYTSGGAEVPGDRRRPAGAGRRPASSPPAGSCRARPSSARAYAASRVTVRRGARAAARRGARRRPPGLRVVRGRRRRCASPSGRLGTIEAQLADVGAGVGASRPRLRLRRRRRRGRGRCSAPTGCSRCAGSTSSTACRSPGSRCGAPSRWRARLSLADVERATFHELLDVELGGATQTIAAGAVGAADAAVLGVPAGSPALVCERVTRSAAGDAVLAVRARLPRPPHPVRRRAAGRRPLRRPERPPPGPVNDVRHSGRGHLFSRTGRPHWAAGS